MAGIAACQLPGGWQVLAGRTDEANDRLSLRLARGNDRWFHIRGMPGSHVVLRVPQGEAPDRPTLELTAAIAAWHSKARGAGAKRVRGIGSGVGRCLMVRLSQPGQPTSRGRSAGPVAIYLRCGGLVLCSRLSSSSARNRPSHS